MIEYTYKEPSHFSSSLCSSLLDNMSTFNNIRESLANITTAIRTFRSTVLGLKNYISPIVEMLNILGQIPKPRNKTKNRIIRGLNDVVDGLVNDISIPLNFIEKAISVMNMSIGNLFIVFDKATNKIYRYGKDKLSEYFGVNTDDDSVIATLKKYSTEIIGCLSTILSTTVTLINQSYSKIINIMNGLITNITTKIAKTINNAVETSDKLSDDEIRSSVNVILSATVLQPIISSLESEIVGKIYECTKPLRKIGDKLGEILNWNFSML